MLKHEIKNILIQLFVEKEIFDSSATSQNLVIQTDLQLRELEIKRQVKMEKLRLVHEERLRSLFVCFVALRNKSTAMVMAGRSVHLTTLFPGQA